MTTPAQRAAEAVAVQLRLFGPDPNWCARVALTAALDEAEMVEAIAQAMAARRVQVNAAAGYHFPSGEAVRRARPDATVAARAIRVWALGEKP